MNLDILTRVCSSQAFTATAVSASSYDLGDTTPVRELPDGDPIAVMINVEVAADSTTGNETYQFDLVSDADVALGSPGVHGSFIATAAILAAGRILILDFPIGNRAYERYLGLQLTLGGTTPTITISAYIGPRSMFARNPIHYADAINV